MHSCIPYEHPIKQQFDHVLTKADIGSFIDQMTQHKTPQEVLDLFVKYEAEIVVAAYQRFKTSDNLFNYAGKKYGDSVFDPVFVFAAVLEWAGIVHNERGELVLTQAYRGLL